MRILIVSGLSWRVVMRAVDENAHAGHALALVLEVGLNVHVGCGLVLCKVREPVTIGIKVIEEFPLELRLGAQRSGSANCIARLAICRSLYQRVTIW